MNKKIINSKTLPPAVGPYSGAIIVDNLIFLSGQLPVEPDTGYTEMENVKKATAIIMNNISNFLKENNLEFKNIIKTTVYLKDMGKFGEFNDEYATYFTAPDFPARECVQPAMLPKNVPVEISAIIQV